MGDMYEEWRIVDIAPNYLISDQGRVQNRTSGKIIKQRLSKGYPTVNLNDNGRMFQQGVHQLVAAAFVEGKQPGLVVNHIDGDKTNSSPENLEWITQSENVIHAVKAGLRQTVIVRGVDGRRMERYSTVFKLPG